MPKTRAVATGTLRAVATLVAPGVCCDKAARRRTVCRHIFLRRRIVSGKLEARSSDDLASPRTAGSNKQCTTICTGMARQYTVCHSVMCDAPAGGGTPLLPNISGFVQYILHI